MISISKVTKPLDSKLSGSLNVYSITSPLLIGTRNSPQIDSEQSSLTLQKMPSFSKALKQTSMLEGAFQ